ncbi:MAG TPA: HD domain-containing phosphohydrolase [Gemmatimonadales bacterium]|nr:HD domain-containing phosphohydrolase [Gemmatimonadales bacterium]
MSHKPRSQVLIVDDDGPRRSELRRSLEQGGYEVAEADSLEAGLQKLLRLRIACVIPVAGPAGSAPDMVARLLKTDPAIAVVVLATSPDMDAATASMRAGAADYQYAEAAQATVVAAVGRALEWRRARAQDRAHAHSLAEEVTRLSRELQGERSRRDRIALAALESLVNVVEAKDLWLAGHSVRVATVAASLAAELSRTDEEVEQIRLAGRLHDIGMVGVGERILSKQGALTADEYAQVKSHVIWGSQILSPLPGLGPVVNFIRHHHERTDGRGYPDGLTDEAIPWGARVIGVAEIYDALTTVRPYRSIMDPERAVLHMEELVGSAIGAAEWTALASVVERREALVFVVDEHPQASLGARASALHL